MAEHPPNSDDLLRQAGSLIAAREGRSGPPLGDEQRTAVQDATLSIVRELRGGRTLSEVEHGLVKAGWQPALAGGFIRLVSQLLAKMYLVRTSIFAVLTLITMMLASVLVPMAGQGEFSWFLAGMMVFMGIFCLLATLRTLQLWRKFRALRSP